LLAADKVQKWSPWAIVSTGTPESDSRDTKLCRISRGVQSAAVSVVLVTTARNERSTLLRLTAW
jgi:hypothetical protein